MQVVLVMFRAEGERRSFSVVRDVTVIGRREDCDLRIPVGEVSRKHCRIVKEGDTLRAEDLGSSNGTFHNGQRIQGSVQLEPGDSVQVGPVVFVVQIDGVPPDDALEPFNDQAAHKLEDSVAPVTHHPPEMEAEALEELPVDEPLAADGEGLEVEPLGEGDLEPLGFDETPEHENASVEHLDDLMDLESGASHESA
jgi:pSer/pThr/pTyr-binding forkhead associated (FHA) protein